MGLTFSRVWERMVRSRRVVNNRTGKVAIGILHPYPTWIGWVSTQELRVGVRSVVPALNFMS